MTWGAIPVPDVIGDPFQVPRARTASVSHPSLLPTDLAIRHLERVREHESSLLRTLGIVADDLEKSVRDKDGPSLHHYIWRQNPPWLSRELMEIAKITMDDLWQIREARVKVHERVMRWKRAFRAQEKIETRPKVPGLDNNLRWLQETYQHRITFAQKLVQQSHHGWDLVGSFYDPAQRTAQNILDGAAAVRHYLKVSLP